MNGPSVAQQRDQDAEQRDIAAEQRDQDAAQRNRAAEQRDLKAEQRDLEAEQRDQDAEEYESQADGGLTSEASNRSALARREGASDRRRAAQDRGSGASDRTQAELDRGTALTDRESGASARSHAELDRNTSQADRAASARDRERGDRSMNEPSSRPPSFSDAEVQLGLLGSFSLRVKAEPLRLPMNAQRLVCFLALRDGLLQRQHVAGSLWGDTTERRAAGSLRSALWRLHHPTYPLVEVADSHLRLSPAVAVDVRASVALAHRILDDSQDLSETDLDAALLTADLLPDWTEDWVLVERENHTQLRLRALEALCRRLTEMGRFGQAIQAGMLAVSGEPLRESAQRTLITAHIAERNMSAATARYDAFRELLLDELGLEPSPEMHALVKGLKR